MWLAALVVSSIASIPLFLALGTRNADDPGFTVGANLITEITLGLGVWLWVRYRHRVGAAVLGLRRAQRNLIAGVVGGGIGLLSSIIVGSVVFQIAREIGGERVETPEQLPGVTSHSLKVASLLLVVMVAPIAEELFFRGFLYQALRRWRGVRGAIVLSGVLFGAAHLRVGDLIGGLAKGDLARFISAMLIVPSTMVLGWVLAYLFERQRSLRAPMVAHGLYNLVVVMSLFNWRL